MQFLKYVLVFSFFLTVISCSNDFDITEDAKDIPVVYGLLTGTDTVQYVRVEKAFVDETKSGLELAMDPSQLYFEDIEVVLKHAASGTEYKMSRIDGNLVGIIRDSGAFANAPNYLYKLSTPNNLLIAGNEYILIIRRNDGEELSRASTRVLRPYANTDVTSPTPTGALVFGYLSDFRVSWDADGNAGIHDIQIIINFTEDKVGAPITKKSVTWTVARNYDRTLFSVKGRAFYDFMAGELEASPNIKRYFDNATLVISSGGKEIKDYILVGQANLGITSSGEIPVYSNLSNGGLGLFSSKSRFERLNIGMNPNTLDSLKNGSITKSLNFK
ncbi:MAG: DUF4249 family protein [Saprospiraceae bacterium]|nr:DUF4249 family protein [Saprospiraceae bacterium]